MKCRAPTVMVESILIPSMVTQILFIIIWENRCRHLVDVVCIQENGILVFATSTMNSSLLQYKQLRRLELRDDIAT